VVAGFGVSISGRIWVSTEVEHGRRWAFMSARSTAGQVELVDFKTSANRPPSPIQTVCGAARQAVRPLAARPVRRYHSIVDPTDLPAGDLIATGLEDLRRGLETIPALLVSIGAPRLRRLGYTVPSGCADPEHRLYALLAGGDHAAAHSRYNALIRRLVSFERAAECVR
jgi:hypothetical protein